MLSSSFLKGIRAIIDTEHGSLWGKLLNRELFLELAAKNLLMMDLNHLWCGKSWEQPAPKSSPCGLIFQSEDVEKLLPAVTAREKQCTLKGFPTPMKQPSTASFESVQKLAPVTPSTAMTAMKHVAHRSETADLSRGPQENQRSDRTPQDQGPDPRIAVAGEGQLWQSEAGPRICSPIMPGRTDWFVQTLEKST